MYNYTAYQLNIQSDFPIPEFPKRAQAGEPDVIIHKSQVPAALENPTGKGVLYQATANQFLLTMHNVASYLVQNGNEIMIEPAPDSLDSDVRVFMLGSCIGALLHQRGLLVIHAAAIHTDKGAVLFTGRSGSGKSTLLGEFMRRGYKMMVDDVCGVVLDETGKPTVLPGYPRTRLWSDSASILEHDITKMEQTRPAMDKYERQAPEQYWDQPAHLHRIYLLTSANQEEVELNPITPLRTFSIVLHNTYRQQFLDGLEMRPSHFTLTSAVAQHCSVRHIIRPRQQLKLTELANMVEQDLVRD
jgi:hypothetical protein